MNGGDEFWRKWEAYRKTLMTPTGERRRIPAPVMKALKEMDFLGYDSAGEALQGIRGHKDWIRRFDAVPEPLDEVTKKRLSSGVKTIEKYVGKTSSMSPKPTAPKSSYSRALFKQQTAKSRKPALKGVKGGRKGKMTAAQKAFAKELSGLRLIRGLISMGGIGAMFYEDIYGPLLQPKPDPWDLGT